MIHFLFDRFSKVVLILETVGIALMAAATARLLLGNPSTLTSTLLVLVIVEYAFIRYCASRRWHHNAPRWSGIEKHLKKAMVPTSYIIAILGALLLLFPSALFLGIAAFLLAVVVHVNIILLYFHFRNKDDTPANYYSGGKFFKSGRLFTGEPTGSHDAAALGSDAWDCVGHQKHPFIT
jgi:hypothetical protein